MNIREALEAVLAMLSPDVPGSVDPRDLNAPCAWISARRATGLTLGGCVDVVTADLFLITRDSGIPTALDRLSEMLDVTLAALDRHGVAVTEIALDEAITLPTGGGPLPAYRVTIEIPLQ